MKTMPTFLDMTTRIPRCIVTIAKVAAGRHAAGASSVAGTRTISSRIVAPLIADVAHARDAIHADAPRESGAASRLSR